ncbi:hypothetical protein [Azoarcus taiwanensis]|uniref:DNA gyrase subunit B n=1 Tax=Azoarcus taiwanensis TaxID=666964 RepID=A0A972JBV6_9RHOO|nr:hypothetical protein [Azoarcus taiwanensis]NMG03847.1 hypothetical protein [Azoarcus taiwanensis]
MRHLVRGVFVAATPVLVYLALDRFEPREVALFVLALFVLRAPVDCVAFFRRQGLRGALALLAVAGVIAFIWGRNDPVWVLAYPVLMNAILFGLFAGSLFRPPSVIERLARLHTPELAPEGVRYTRQVTAVWCGFFVINGGIAWWTAVAASREVWVLYNGLVSYLLMGMLFAGEWCVRRRVIAAGGHQ